MATSLNVFNQQFDDVLGVFADISENQPEAFRKILSEVVEKLQDVISICSLSFKQKFAFLESLCTIINHSEPVQGTLLGNEESLAGTQTKLRLIG